MTLVCHFVAYSNDSVQGGLQETVHRLAARLAALDGVRVVVYTLGPAASGGVPYEVQDLLAERAHLAAPLPAEPPGSSPLRLKGLSSEGFQINRLLLRARIESALDAAPRARHVAVSFFLTSLGFTTELVARELGLAHVAFLAGTDLNRDAASPAGAAAAAFVTAGADWIVASNRDQVARLGQLFGRWERISVSNGALPPGRPRAYWARPDGRDAVALVSDCGYSFKKATHLLVEAFGRLREAGPPVTLTVVGRTDQDQGDYWEAARRGWRSRFPGEADFRGYVAKDDLEVVLLASDVYCSASLGEGEPERGPLRPRARHAGRRAVVQLPGRPGGPGGEPGGAAARGDRADLYARLVEVVDAVRAGPGPTDRSRLDALRRHLWDSEAVDWLDLLGRVARRPGTRA